MDGSKNVFCPLNAVSGSGSAMILSDLKGGNSSNELDEEIGNCGPY